MCLQKLHYLTKEIIELCDLQDNIFGKKNIVQPREIKIIEADDI